PGHPGHFHALLPVDQVDQVVVVAPEVCRHYGQIFPSTLPRRSARAWRHQVVELVGRLTLRGPEHQMEVRRWTAWGRRARADLPAGVPKGAFGPKLTAVAAMLLGRYRLSRREVQRLMADLWEVPVSLGGVARLQQSQSEALKTPYDEARRAVQQAAVV